MAKYDRKFANKNISLLLIKHVPALFFVYPAFQCIPEKIYLHLHEYWEVSSGKNVYMALAHCHFVSFGAG